MDGEGGEYGRYQETYFLRAMPGFFCFRFACEDQPASEIGGVLNCDFKLRICVLPRPPTGLPVRFILLRLDLKKKIFVCVVTPLQ